jgi:hypothetical protein
MEDSYSIQRLHELHGIALYCIGKGTSFFLEDPERRRETGSCDCCDSCFAMTIVAVAFCCQFEDLFYQERRMTVRWVL